MYSAHYLNEAGLARNIPRSVVDETIDHGQVFEELPDRTIYYDALKDVTVVQIDTTGAIMSPRPIAMPVMPGSQPKSEPGALAVETAESLEKPSDSESSGGET